MKKNPCYKCDKRNKECHIKCEEYKKYAEYIKDINNKMKNAQGSEIDNYKLISKIKNDKKYGR